MKQDIFIVLGGGLNYDGTLPEHVQNRIDWVINRQTRVDIVLFSALYSLNVSPKLSEDGFPLSEAHEMAKYFLKKQNVKCKVFLENASFDTIGSAMFVRLHYLDRLHFNLKNLYLISSDFHIERAERIYRKILSLSPNPIRNKLNPVGVKTRIKNQARSKREKSSLAIFNEIYRDIHTMSASLDWMFSHHKSYNNSFVTGSVKKDNLLY